MERLTYTVEVDSGDRDTDRVYLQHVRETFRMITERLASYGYTCDETISRSEINTAPTATDSSESLMLVGIIDRHFPCNSIS